MYDFSTHIPHFAQNKAATQKPCTLELSHSWTEKVQSWSLRRATEPAKGRHNANVFLIIILIDFNFKILQ